MKLNKIVLSSVIGIALTLPVGSLTKADSIEQEKLNETKAIEGTNLEKEDTIIVPYVDWSGNAYLTRNVWTNVTASNNVFTDTPTVTNVAGNPGTAKFRIVNGRGDVILESGYVDPGKSTSIGPIPAFSGTYTLQAVVEKTGTYNIKIN